MYGNVEGREAFSGDIDILVTDGFTGNVFLKAVEGLRKICKKNSIRKFKEKHTFKNSSNSKLTCNK